MKVFRNLCFILVYICVCCSTIVYSSELEFEDTQKTYIIGTKIFEPFVIKDGKGALSGISIDILKELAVQLNFRYQLVLYDDLQSLFQNVEESRLDFAISGLSITKDREINMDFSYPYYQTGLAVLLFNSEYGYVQLFKNFFSMIFSANILKSIFILVSVIFLISNIIWVIERNNNSQFSKKYWKGIRDSIWWSTVTVTTVGYGDKVPRSFFGRTISVLWMFVGIFLISFFTASISSALTVQKLDRSISEVADLAGKKVGTISGSTASFFLNSIHANVYQYSDFEQALFPLVSKELDAFVYDFPRLKYYVQKFKKSNLEVLDITFDSQFYGIAFPSNSNLREKVNRGILSLEESGELDLIIRKWLR